MKQRWKRVDCFVAIAPRNDEWGSLRSYHYLQQQRFTGVDTQAHDLPVVPIGRGWRH
jgi:hypothetical protein